MAISKSSPQAPCLLCRGRGSGIEHLSNPSEWFAARKIGFRQSSLSEFRFRIRRQI